VASAIGDLVVTLGCDNNTFVAALNGSGASLDEFAGHTRGGSHAMQEFAEHSEEAGGHVAGANRAFKFLGKEVKELGEGLGGTESALGGTVTTLGETVTGLGEAMHGYHALHTAITVATGAQVFLNSISPLGWVALAAGAIAVGYAYVTMSSHAETAEEATKRVKKTLGELDALHGAAFERAAGEKTKELQSKIDEAQKVAEEHTDMKIGAIAGPLGMAAGYLYEQHAIESAKSALDEFNEAAAKHRQEEAAKSADSALDHMVEQAEKLNKTPLEEFIEQLRKSGRTAIEQAKEIAQFKEAAARVDEAHAAKALAKKEEEMRESGMTEGQKYVAHFSEENPHATAAQKELAEQQGAREDAIKNQARLQKETDAERLKAEEKVHSLVDSLKSPMDKLIDDAKQLKEQHARGLLSDYDYSTGMSALQAKGEKETAVKEKAKDEGPAAALDFGSAQAYEAIYKAMNPEENQPAKQTAENTAKMHVLLGEIADGLKNTVRLGS
jgi:hypothetical protein